MWKQRMEKLNKLKKKIHQTVVVIKKREETKMQHTNFMADLSIYTTTHTGTSTLQADASTTTVSMSRVNELTNEFGRCKMCPRKSEKKI